MDIKKKMKFLSNQIKVSKVKVPIPKIINKIIDLKQRINPQRWGNKSIVWYTGHTPNQWSPDSLKTGVGGSELALINLSKEWSKLGYQVTVYNNCGTKEGIYNGVKYCHYSKFNKYDTFDTLIIWRYPWRLYPKTKANRIFLEVQEVLLPEQVIQKKLNKFSKIFVKCHYHRTLFPEISDEQIAIISNGSDDFLKYQNQSKDPYKLIYASNYIRGLERMLTYGWPIIQKEVPQAHLHIYYGWSNLDESNSEKRVWKARMIELMKQPGVTEHGKVGLEELIKEKATASIHYYGCTFQETDCISVRESAMVGCLPVTTAHAALKEKDYCVKVSGNPYAQETQENLADKIVELLKNQQQLEKIRQESQELVKKETWKNIAKAWLDVIDISKHK